MIANNITFCNSKENINAESKKILRKCSLLISLLLIQFLDGDFASESQLNHSKCIKTKNMQFQ